MTANISKDFGLPENTIWINCAHQGPLPNVAAKEAQEAIAWKVTPYELTTERFSGVPARMKRALGKLIGAPPEDIILANSASYGLHLLANGIPLQSGDEVLLMKNDFPSDILPWLALQKRGVNVRQLQPHRVVLQADEVAENISSATRVLCLTWVHSFSGFAIDLNAIGKICRQHGVWFVVNCSQAIGTRPIDVTTAPVDAISCVGFKWLCGPYGTGFCWIRPELREQLEYNQAYWLSSLTADDLSREQSDFSLPDDLDARKFDIFGTANFFNFKPWAASVEYLLQHGIDRIAEKNAQLVSHFSSNLDLKKYVLLSPSEGTERSTLIFISHKNPSQNQNVFETLRKEGIYISYRMGKLRFAPHFFNTEADLDRALEVLESIR